MAGKKPTKKGEWIDPDDAPELTKEWFERAEIWHGDKLIRPGKPKAEAPKKAKRRDRQKVTAPKAEAPKKAKRRDRQKVTAPKARG